MNSPNGEQELQRRKEERRFILWSIARANPGRSRHPWRFEPAPVVGTHDRAVLAKFAISFVTKTRSMAKHLFVFSSYIVAKARRTDSRKKLSIVCFGILSSYLLLCVVIAEQRYLMEESILFSLAEEYETELGTATLESKKRANVIAVRAPGTGFLSFIGIRSFDRIVRLEIRKHKDIKESSLSALASLQKLERIVLGDRGPSRFSISINQESRKNWNRILRLIQLEKKRHNDAMGTKGSSQ